MPTNTTSAQLADPYVSESVPRTSRSITYFSSAAETNLTTYYRMSGYDTISNSWKAWIVSGTPDPTAARYFDPSTGAGPSSVSIANGAIVDRWQG